MALTSFCSPRIIAKRSGIPVWPGDNGVTMIKQYEVPIKKAPVIAVRCFCKHKVYENVSEGIICYRDENGEIICEGYDEGPRFEQIHHRTTRDPSCREAEMMNLVQQRLLRIVKGSCVGVQEDCKSNGLNK